ncbi:MAG TPA: HepT-like ribonuclease domain-containing protein [Actinomycetes bacterium]|nr:HepT-like ribonuclease domain-containing protein [Actinomycetes bacterium]
MGEGHREAARGLTEELRQAHPEVPWRQMIAMRNVLIHGYFDIDVDLVWSVADNDLPKLAAQIRAIVKEVP